MKQGGMSERWTPAYARMFDPEYHLAGDPACRRWAWLDLCHMAAWKDRTRILGTLVVHLERGELVVSLRFLAERWGWSVKKVRDFLEILQHPDVGKLETVKGTPKGTVYRVVSYDTYANPGHTQGHSEGHDQGTGRAQVGHKEQQEQQEQQEPLSSGLEELWRVSRRGSKKKALEQYRKARTKKGVDHDTMLTSWKAYVTAAGESQYVAHLWRWIRDERWEEDVPSTNGKPDDRPSEIERMRRLKAETLAQRDAHA